jgi:hypothetical protein
MPDFGPAGGLTFHAYEGSSTFAFRIREDGARRRKLVPQQISELNGVSLDRHWVIGRGGHSR